MIKKEKDGVIWFEFEKLQAFTQLRHAVFSRCGGNSQTPFGPLNMSTYVGDEPSNVQHNRKLARKSACLQVPLATSLQTHGNNVYAIETALENDVEVSGYDAFVTNQKNSALGIQHADCQAAIFFDPIKQAIGCVHAGWKGSCKNIYKETMAKMDALYGSNPKDLIVCISPSLGPEKAEFINYERELPQEFWPFKSATNYFDFWQISRHQLEKEGVQPDNIEIAGLCTYSDSEHFFSARRDKICGRHLTAVWLLE